MPEVNGEESLRLKATGSFPRALKLKMMLFLLKIRRGTGSNRSIVAKKDGIWGFLERKRMVFVITYSFLPEEGDNNSFQRFQRMQTLKRFGHGLHRASGF